jgi:hypothetical protein
VEVGDGLVQHRIGSEKRMWAYQWWHSMALVEHTETSKAQALGYGGWTGSSDTRALVLHELFSVWVTVDVLLIDAQTTYMLIRS